MKIHSAILAVGYLAMLSGAVWAAENELELADINAFAIGTDRNISSVRQVDADSFNVALKAARNRGEAWAQSFIQIGLRFVGGELSGSRRAIRVQVEPPEWEPKRSLKWAKVIIEDEGWLDDSIAGERYVIWLVPDGDRGVVVGRALWAQLCSRHYWTFYSAKPCP